MGRGTRAHAQATGVAISNEEIRRSLRSHAPARAAWTLWPPNQLVGPKPDVRVHTPEWSAYLRRKELGRALLAARADAVTIDESQFSETLCGKLAGRVFALLSVEPELGDDMPTAIRSAHAELAETVAEEQRGPFACFAYIAAAHIHRAYWNQDGSEAGNLFRMRGMLESPRDEIVELDKAAEPWLRRTIRELRYR